MCQTHAALVNFGCCLDPSVSLNTSPIPRDGTYRCINRREAARLTWRRYVMRGVYDVSPGGNGAVGQDQ